MMSSGIWNDIDMELGLDAPSEKTLTAEKFPPATSNSMTESNGADFTTTTSSVPPSSTVYSILSKPIVIAGERERERERERNENYIVEAHLKLHPYNFVQNVSFLIDV